MGDNDKLIGRLTLDLNKLKSDVSQANDILEDLSKIKINSIDDESGKKSIEVLHSIEEEFNKLKETSGESFDTQVFKSIEQSILSLSNNLGTITTKVTDFFKSSADEAEKTVQKYKTVTESVDAYNRKIAETKYAPQKNKDGSITQKSPTTKIIDDKSGTLAKNYADDLAKIDAQYQKMRADSDLTVEGLQKLKSALSEVEKSYSPEGAAASKLYKMQSAYSGKIDSLNNPKDTENSSSVNAYKQELAQIQNEHNQFATENKLDIEALTNLNSKLDVLKDKYKLTETELKPLISTQKQYTDEINKQNEIEQKQSGKSTDTYLNSYKSQLDAVKQSYLSLDSTETQRVSDLNKLSQSIKNIIETLGLEGSALSEATSQMNKYSNEAKDLQSSSNLNSYKESLSGLKNSFSELSSSGQATIESLSKLKEENENLRNSFELTNSQMSSSVSFGSRLSSAINKITEDQKKLADATEKQTLASLKQYTQDQANTAEYTKMSEQLAKFSGEQKLAMSSSNAGSSISDRFKVSSVYAASAMAIYQTQSAFTSAIKTNEDYETSLTDLGRVLGNVSDKDLKGLGQSAIQLSKDFGEPLQQVQDAMNSLASAGVQDKTSLESMTKTVMMGVNTSDIKDASEMTNLLTSSMKQLGISYTDSEKVLDSWNKMADVSLAKTSDYAEAVSKAGMTSKAMGIDLNQLNGIVSILADNTGKSGNEIGDALKSAETRLERPETLNTLKQYGIEVMKDKDHFKDFGDIMKEVSSVLDKYGENTTQSNAIEDALGGTMRKDWIDILAQNYGQVDKMAQESANSVGYSATKSEKTMQTLGKQVEVLKTTVQQFFISLGDNGGTGQLKAIVSGAKDVMDVLTEIPAPAQRLLILIPEVAIAFKGLSEALKIFKGEGIRQLLDSITKIPQFNIGNLNFGGESTTVKAYDAAVNSLAEDIKKGNITEEESSTILGVVGEKLNMAKSSTNVLAAAEQALNEKVEAGTITDKEAEVAMDALRTKTGANATTTKAATASEEALAASQKMTLASTLALNVAMGVIVFAVSGAITAFMSMHKSTEDIGNDIDDLSSKLNSAKQNDVLIQKYESLQKQLKNTSEASQDYATIQDQVTQVQEQLGEQFPTLVTGYDNQGKAIATNTKKLEAYNKAKKEQLLAESATDYAKMYNTVTKRTEPDAVSLNAGVSPTDDRYLSQIQLYTKYTKLLDDETKKNGIDTQGYGDKLKTVTSNIENFNKAAVQQYAGGNKNAQYFDTVSGKLEKYSTYLKQSTDSTNKDTSAKKTDSSATSTMGNAAAKAGSQVNAFGVATGTATADQKALADKVKSAISALEELNGAYKKIHSGQSLDAEDMLTLVENNTELLGAVQKTKDGYTLNGNALKDLIAVKKADAEAGIVSQISTEQSQISATQATISSAQSRIKKYQDEGYALTNLAQQVKILENAMKESSGAEQKSIKKDIDDLEALNKATQNLASAQNDLSTQQANLNKLNQEKSNLDSLFDDIGKDKGDGSDKSPEQKAEEAAQKQQEAVQKQQEAAEEAQRKQQEALRKSLEAQKKEADQLLDDSYKIQKQHDDDIVNSLQAQLTALERKKQLTEDENELLKDQNDLAKAQSELDYTQNQQDTRTLTANGWQWTADADAVKSAQQKVQDAQDTVNKKKSDMDYQQQEDDLNDKIKAAEDTRDTNEQNYQDKKSSIDQSYEDKIDAIGGYATGTDYVPESGIYTLAEGDVPELVTKEQKVHLPQGAQVINGSQTAQILGGTNSAIQSVVDNNTNSASNAVVKSTQNALNAASNAIKSFTNNSTSFSRNGNKVLGKAILDNKDLVEKPLNTLINNVKNDMDDFVDSSPEYSKSSDKNIGKSILDNKDLIEKPLSTLINNVKSNIEEFVNYSPQYSKNTNKNVGTTITTTSSSVIDPTKQLLNDLNTTIVAFVNTSNQYGLNITKDIGQGMKDGTKDLEKTINDLCTTIINDFHNDLGIHSPSTIAHEIGSFWMQGLINGMTEADIESIISNKMGSVVNSTQVSLTGNVASWIQQAMKDTGTPDSWLAGLEMITSRESGSPGQLGTGNPNLKNSIPVDGEFATGLMQMLPSTFRENMRAGHNNILNPVDNIESAIDYIKKRYGSVYNIPNWNNGSYRGYEDGTTSALPGWATVNEKGQEMRLMNDGDGVVTAKRTQSISDFADKIPDILSMFKVPSFEMPEIKVEMPSSSKGGDTNINLGNMSFPNVKKGSQIITELQQIVKTHNY